MIYPEVLQKLINYFKKLPGIGEKSAEKMALFVLEFNDDDIQDFSEAMILAKKNLNKCNICGHITDEEICNICSNESRSKELICIIEDYKSVFAFEKVGNYSGVYHVLGGLISPINGIGPEDINLSKLSERVKKMENPELIMALKSSIEGETTTLYVKKTFENDKVTISRLSYGLPMGAEIEYLDIMTLDKALEDRKRISDDII